MNMIKIGKNLSSEKSVVRTPSRPAAFQPNRLIRGGTIQTFASSLTARSGCSMMPGEQVVILDAGHDQTGYDESVRLVGYYNQRERGEESQGLVISLHGWEGCSHSAYNLITGRRLLAEGYDLFRLNLRDHGPGTHVSPYALNRGLFLGTLLDEVHTAVQQVAAWAGELPVYLVGPSIGGNFALRMAVLHATRPIANLRRVVAISPAINPGRATERIDSQYPFRRYFRDRWLNSLLSKQKLFPNLYDFGPVVGMVRLRTMTEWLVAHYSHYANADDYFSRYSVMGDALAELSVATTILTAADDPVIGIEDFETLTPSPHLDMKIERYGGHVGFVDLWPLRHLLPEMILGVLQRK